MRSKMAVMTAVLAIAFVIGCGKDDVTGPTENEGTLQFAMTVWNQYNPVVFNTPSFDADTLTCDIINAKTIIYKLEVTTGDIIDGEPDTLSWVTLHESSEEMLHTEREFSIDIPAGVYTGFKVTQRNRVYWICTLEADTLEFPSLNDGSLAPDASLINILGENGLYLYDEDGNFSLEQPDEKLGSFEISSGEITKVTCRVNFMTLDWLDNDGNGEWSDGDELDNWTLPDGIDTMSDFIIEYE